MFCVPQHNSAWRSLYAGQSLTSAAIGLPWSVWKMCAHRKHWCAIFWLYSSAEALESWLKQLSSTSQLMLYNSQRHKRTLSCRSHTHTHTAYSITAYRKSSIYARVHIRAIEWECKFSKNFQCYQDYQFCTTTGHSHTYLDCGAVELNSIQTLICFHMIFVVALRTHSTNDTQLNRAKLSSAYSPIDDLFESVHYPFCMKSQRAILQPWNFSFSLLRVLSRTSTAVVYLYQFVCVPDGLRD